MAEQPMYRQIADDLKYVPNVTARSLVMQSSATFGLMTPDVTDQIHGQFVTGFQQRAAPRHIAIHERAVLRIETRAVKIHLPRHRPIVALAFPMIRRREESHTRRVTGDDRLRRHALHGEPAIAQVFA